MIHAILPLFSALLFFALGVTIYFLNKGEAKNAYIRFCYFTFHWQFSWFLLFLLNDIRYADLIIRIGYSGIIFLPASFYECVCKYMGIRSKRTTVFYSLGVVFLVFLWTTDLFIKGPVTYYFGMYPEAGFVHIFYMGMVLFAVAGTVFNLFRILVKEKDVVQRRQIKFLFIALLMYCPACTDYLLNYPGLLSRFNIHLYPVGVFFIISALLIFILAHFMILTSRLSLLNFSLEKTVEIKTAALQKSFQELQISDQMQKQFFTNISHEIRTPLTSILAPVDALRLGDAGPINTEQRKMIEQVYRNGLRLLDMINQLLDLSKIVDGKMPVILSKLDAAKLTKDVVTLFEGVVHHKGLTISYAASEHDKSFYLDKDKFERILTNLIRNAVKFTENGSIYVRTRFDKNHFILEVGDTGIGIPAEYKQKIFERFGQVDGSETRKYEGSGLGLNIVKESVDLMKGQISVESTLGKGTVFTVFLPLNLKELLPAAIKDRRAPVSSKQETQQGIDEKIAIEQRKSFDGKLSVKDLISTDWILTDDNENASAPGSADEKIDQIKVLYVEDNSDLRIFFVNMLTKFGYKVFSAVNGADAWHCVQKEHPDVVVTDIMMPVMNGYELIKKIKTEKKTMNIPVILISAKSEVESKIEGFGVGADEYMSKPVNIRELDARIRNLIIGRKFQIATALAEALETRAEELTMSFAQSLESRDFHTAGHSKDVLSLGMMIADELDLPVNRLLKDALLLHDIGKLGIPDRILFKNTTLDEDEWEIMKKHAELGARLLAHFDSLKDVAHIVHAHQEHYDGTGYPGQLQGEAIPIEARIIAVADAYHAMTSDRPYRKALTPDKAMDELRRCRGSQFDSKIVDAFISGISSGPLSNKITEA